MDDEGRHGLGLLEGILDELLNGLAVTLRVERAAAVILNEDASRRAVATRGITATEQQALTHWLAVDAEGRAYREQLSAAARPVYVSDGWRRVESPTLPQSALPFVPHLAVPLLGSGGVLIGMIELEMTLPRQQQIDMAAATSQAITIAIEQTLAAEACRAEVTRLTTVLDIVREVDQRLDLPDVLAAICRKTVEAFGCQNATVFFYSRRRRASLPIADYGTPPHVAARFLGSQYIAGSIPYEHELAAGRTVVISRDRNPSPEDIALLDLSESYGIVLIPLRADDSTTRGILNVGLTDRRDFTADELHALEVVALHAATAILRARFLRATEETARFRAAVSALAVELNATSSRTQTLHILCARSCEIFGVGAALFLLHAGDRLVASSAHGTLPEAEHIVIGFHATESPAVRAFLTGEVVLENDLELRDSGEPLAGLRSILAIPLIGTEGRAGVLVLGDPRPRRFDPLVVEEAPVLGALAGAVLRNLELLGQLHASNEQLQRVSTLKDQFLATVSHDLRTPLNVIIGYAQLALENSFGVPDAELRNVIERMLASANQQLNLVEDLLDLSRLELDSLTVKLTRVALAPVFEEMEFLATSLVRQKPVRVAVEPVAPGLCVEADPYRLKQILTNLLSNAAKFTDEGTIRLRAIAGAPMIGIEVSDTGIGIPAGEQEAIFEPFRQVDDHRAELGTGLGLAIVRRLTALMGGTLALDSTLGRGSTFRVSLNVARPAAPNA